MNWKQRILTLLALAMFLTIGWLHLAEIGKVERADSARLRRFGERPIVLDAGLVPHPITPWLMLGVTYAALFFLLASRRQCAE
jgi:hypothetical protein